MPQTNCSEFINQLFQNGFLPLDVLSDPDDIAPYCTDWRGLRQTSAQAVILPRSPEMIQTVLRLANDHKILVTPQGGRTGLVFGSIPSGSTDLPEVILSTSRLNQILQVDKLNRTMTVEAGCILDSIINAADEVDYLFPLSLGAKGSCQIGGNLATNAGGINVLRYGNARAQCLGLEAVLADGRLVSDLSGLRKDNRGYDLTQLLIGTEGTLGVITKAVLKLFPKPKAYVTFAIGLDTPAQALELLTNLQDAIGDQITSFELISHPAQVGVDTYSEAVKLPFTPTPYLILGEASLFAAIDAQRDAIFEVLFRANEDCSLGENSVVVAQNNRQRDELWLMREEVVLCQAKAGPSIKHDISVPISALPDMIEEGIKIAQDVVPGCIPSPFGHAGDGNLHFNITAPPTWSQTQFFEHYDNMNRAIHDLVHRLGGSFSAEHGIGELKAKELVDRLDGDNLEIMRSIKKSIDPNNILNRAKIFEYFRQKNKETSK